MAEQDENLVIYAYKNIDDPESGKLFSVPHKIYTDDQWKVTGGAAAIPLVLLSYGTVAANMPNDGTGVGGFCYLVNLPAMRPPSIDPTQVAGLTPGQQQALKRPGPRLKPAQVMDAIKQLIGSANATTPEEQEQLKRLNEIAQGLT